MDYVLNVRVNLQSVFGPSELTSIMQTVILLSGICEPRPPCAPAKLKSLWAYPVGDDLVNGLGVLTLVDEARGSHEPVQSRAQQLLSIPPDC